MICNCEYVGHMKDEYPTSELHDYLATVEDGKHTAIYVGPVCDDCANSHLKDWLEVEA